jgi:hypothetical protein
MPYREIASAYRWVIGVLLAMVISVGGWGLLKVTELDAEVAGNQQQIQTLRRDIDGFNVRFDRVEQKLDALRYPQREWPRPRNQSPYDNER